MAIREKQYKGDAASQGSEASDPPTISPFRRALEDYRDALHAAWQYVDAAQRVNEVWRADVVASPVVPADYASYLEHAAALAHKLQDAWLPPDTTQRFNTALTEYIKSIKEACAKLDPETVQPSDLAMVADTVLQASCLLGVPLQRKSKGAAAATAT
jgi:hypothetical protein